MQNLQYKRNDSKTDSLNKRHTRAEKRVGGETSQLALVRCMMRGVLGRERSRARTVEKWRVKQNFVAHTKFTVTDERQDILRCRLVAVICIQFASFE